GLIGSVIRSKFTLLRAPHQIPVFDPGSKLGLSSPNQILGFAILFDLQQRRCSYALTTPTMEDLRVSLQSPRHSFLQTVTGCFDSSSLMTVLTHSATQNTFPHSLHLPFVQGAESFLRLQVFKELISISLMDFRLTTSTSFNQGSLKNTCLRKGKKILEEKLISLKSSFLEERIGSQHSFYFALEVVMLVATSRSRLNYDFTTSKLMFLIQMALSGFQLTEWNKQSSAKEVMHRTQRDMYVHERNNEGFISYSEFTCKALTHSHWVAPVHQQRRAQRSSAVKRRELKYDHERI
ncbi:hypothetical protein HID58_052556, partial [Brassica napus]